MKVLWIILGVLGGLCLICAGGGYFLFSKGKAVLDEASTYASNSLSAIGTNWSYEEFQKRGPDIVRDNGEEKIQKLLQIYQDKLGTLQDKPAGTVSSFHANSVNGASETTADWSAKAKFAKGEGTVMIHLVNRGSGWQMTEFNIQSPALSGVSLN
jgi:hypothetical protein